ncbi:MULTISPECIES: hypothetical protein [unclassified Novosphingobium]|uniref:hypothetical protein n=1 Tax=unclassified Novosphingobium TaxID=2644732 RepID=UPI000D439F5E|nr:MULTISPECIES: hypothetical protein [unclassified Novosphingobium]PTR05798.1 hypothetical protein C8K11_1252 [Novosphingobium sp. GV055]PUA94356.1 hypothetical protein C8K12_1252 [Novosphingobium sp. GV061]PUB12662.1 hypothetical protein C8K14_1252 [Novosphingobium sp. GV079]PUB38027.1 hypothetical protein C8K10_1252 [Novosphingobium sp. GV027]
MSNYPSNYNPSLDDSEKGIDLSFLRKIDKVSAWLGIFWVIAFMGTFGILSHNIPPPHANWTGQELVDNYYLPYKTSIMVGESLAAVVGFLYAPLTCLLTALMWKRERGNHTLSLMQLAGGLITAWTLIQSPVLWAWSAEMAGQINPDIIKSVHTLGWYLINMIYLITTMQCFALGIFTLADKSEILIFPRWAAWFAFFAGLSFTTETLLPFCKTGAFAYGGWWNFFGGAIFWLSFYLIYNIYAIKYLYRRDAMDIA